MLTENEMIEQAMSMIEQANQLLASVMKVRDMEESTVSAANCVSGIFYRIKNSSQQYKALSNRDIDKGLRAFTVNFSFAWFDNNARMIEVKEESKDV